MSDVANGDYPTRPSNYSDLFIRLDRIEDKLDQRLNTVDDKVDGLTSRLDRIEGKLEGSLGLIRWLGPASLVALFVGLARSMDLI